MRIGKADRQHEANSLFMHFCEEPYKAASVQAIKAGGGGAGVPPCFSTLALDGDEWSFSGPSHLLLWKGVVTY